MKKTAVFVDVDLTLLRCESFRTFIVKEYLQADSLSKLKLVFYYLLRHIGKINAGQFKRHCLSYLIGMKRSEIEAIGVRFAQNVLLKDMRPGAYKTLKKHKNNGLPVYLISASPQFYIKELSNQLRLSGSFATELKFDSEDKFTGAFEGNECVEEEKLLRLSHYCERMGINLKASFFYSDSHKDLPLLMAVGVPIAVCPDKQLKKMGQQKGWTIEYW